ncbi:MAG: DUF6760 family protein [Caldilineaceae bacterium]
MKPFTTLLPGGYLDTTGERHRAVELTSLSGQEEELIADGQQAPRAALVTQILSHCVQRIGAISPVSEAIVRALLVPDRQFLMLKLREATFGDQVQATIHCPWSDCCKPVDIDFSLHDIVVTEAAELAPTYALQLSDAAAYRDETGKPHQHVVFRLPTGADQEHIAPLVLQDEQRAFLCLLNRCIQSMDEAPVANQECATWLSPTAQAEIEQAMAQVSPQVDLTLSGLCPECGRAFTQPFDIQAFLLAELRTNRRQLYREVHYLAYHYHWSEREILALPRAKRRMYIEILADEMEQLHNGIQ